MTTYGPIHCTNMKVKKDYESWEQYSHFVSSILMIFQLLSIPLPRITLSAVIPLQPTLIVELLKHYEGNLNKWSIINAWNRDCECWIRIIIYQHFVSYYITSSENNVSLLDLMFNNCAHHSQTTCKCLYVLFKTLVIL